MTHEENWYADQRRRLSGSERSHERSCEDLVQQWGGIGNLWLSGRLQGADLQQISDADRPGFLRHPDKGRYHAGDFPHTVQNHPGSR